MQVVAGGILCKVSQACRPTGCQLGKLHHPSYIDVSCRRDWCTTSSSCSSCNKQRSISSRHRSDAVSCTWMMTASRVYVRMAAEVIVCNVIMTFVWCNTWCCFHFTIKHMHRMFNYQTELCMHRDWLCKYLLVYIWLIFYDTDRCLWHSVSCI